MMGRSIDGRELVCKQFVLCSERHALRKSEEGESWKVTGSYLEIEGIIIEYSLAKVCSILGVGNPVGSPDHQFDLLCYTDCIEFFMGKGTPLSSTAFTCERAAEIEEQLKYCLKVIHAFGIVHKDIKPQNILID